MSGGLCDGFEVGVRGPQVSAEEGAGHRPGGGLAPQPGLTVADAVREWLDFGLAGRSADTIANYRTIAEGHIVKPLGAKRLKGRTPHLSADDVDRWLRAESRKVSTRTLRLMHSILSRAIRRAMARDKAKRNVVILCEVPTGKSGRPSKSLSFEQAEALLAAAEKATMDAYIVVSPLVGARTEELRALRWTEVDLDGRPHATPPVPPSIAVYRSVGVGGDTKTTKARRRLALPQRCVDVLRRHRTRLPQPPASGDFVFATARGTALDAHNVRRSFRRVVAAAGLNPR